jgi:uncharacterized membrane protein SirB2
MTKFLDDILILAGCGLILVGVHEVLPVATWFVAGVMLIVMGVLVGIGNGKGKK